MPNDRGIGASTLDWAELVFHVLAQVESTAHLPSSLYDAEYVVTAERRLGAATRRPLGDDLVALSQLLTDHEVLCCVQLVAILHPTVEAARRVARFPIAALPSDGCSRIDVRDPLLRRCETAAEMLRCAALLEAEYFSRWPLPDLTLCHVEAERGLLRLRDVAPKLRETRLCLLRSLGWRGRAWPDEIWVGVPYERQGLYLDHVLWQAAHEATVLEVAERWPKSAPPLSEREVERLAVALLARRATHHGLATSHEKWLRRLDGEAAAWARSAGLNPTERSWLEGVTTASES